MSARFCASCGRPVESSNDATIVEPEPAPVTPRRSSAAVRTPSSSSLLTNSDAISGSRFAPGAIVAGRYRIVALVGRGGMGEVYRAEDLKLSQSVAIKFLPESVSQDAAVLERFHAEVRIARQVSHPNVCHVFDIGESDGVPFLTMEYVGGEDLASLLRRIGRLSPDKGTEIARQICAGVAAAHDRGVIHRDLKPSNVMLDAEGKVRVTDFGLAGISAGLRAADARAGTPAYMAPEQLAGSEVTAKSDIYSLGLVLYEIFTGKRAYDAATLPELMRLRSKSAPASPATLIPDLDPLIGRAILRCLEKDPAARPTSALQLAAALPGGDPLAAALAAGETPSPEMVAAAGQTEGMRPRPALALLTLTIVGLIGYLFIAESTRLSNRGVLENPPEVLAARTREIVTQLGYTEKPEDSAFSFALATDDYVAYIREHDKTRTRWDVLTADRSPTVVFWYRQSPRELRPQRFFSSGGAGRVTEFDPPIDVTGMVYLVVDMRGRLVHLEAVPPQQDAATREAPAADWSALFSAAGVNRAAFHPVSPEWTPLAWGDARAAWTGSFPERTDLPMRIEAAAYRGKPIYFDLIYPWARPERSAVHERTPAEKASVLTACVIFFAVLLGGVLVARHNLRLGRVDGRGAFRLGSFVLLAFLTMWALRAHHVASLNEIDLFIIAVSWGLLAAALVVLLYLALEPYVRRKDPQTLISWSRLLAGRFRDPLVGRDLLVGSLYGVALVLFESSDNFILPWLGKLRAAAGILLDYVLVFVVYALGVFFVLFLLRLLLRKDWLAAIATVGLFSTPGLVGEYPIFLFVFLGVIWVSILLVLKRFGLLVMVIGLVVQTVLTLFPVTTHFSRWYAAPALVGLVATAGLAVYGFQRARAGQPLFSGATLDD